MTHEDSIPDDGRRWMTVEHNGETFEVEVVIDDSPATLAAWRRMPALVGQLVEKHRRDYGQADAGEEGGR